MSLALYQVDVAMEIAIRCISNYTRMRNLVCNDSLHACM